MRTEIRAISPAKKHYNAPEERERNIVGMRLLEARKVRGWTLADLCERLRDYGVETTRSSVSKWETGATIPNAYQLVALCKVLGIVDEISYFTASQNAELNENGLRKVQEYRSDLIASGNYLPCQPEEAYIEYVDMPLSLLSASAGTGQFLDEGNYEMVSFPKSSVPEKADFALRIAGDSMEPVYHDGQVIWVQECSELRPGQVGIFVYDGNGYIKALGEREPDEAETTLFMGEDGSAGKQPILISYNKAYRPIRISPELDFKIIGKVL